MGFFEDEDISDLKNAEVDPFAIPVGTTPVYVEKSEVKEFATKDDPKEKVWLITFREAVERNGKPSTRRHTEWLKSPRYVPEETKKAYRRGQAKKVLTALGIPANRLNEVEPEEVLGIQGTIKLYEKNGYKQFGKFDVSTSGQAGDGLVTGTPDLDGLKVFAKAGADDYFS